MGFYSNSTPEYRRISELTGDVHLSEDFKKEINTRKIPLYKAYSIQKRLLHEAEQELLKTKDDVDKRIMELLEENTEIDIVSDYKSKCNSFEGATKIPSIPKEVSASKGVILGITSKKDIFIPIRGHELVKPD